YAPVGHAASLSQRTFQPLRDVSRKLGSYRRPYSYIFSKELQRDLDSALREPFDVLHLEQTWSAWLGLKHAERALLNVHYLMAVDLGISGVEGSGSIVQQPPYSGGSLSSFFSHLRRNRSFAAEQELIQRYRHMAAVSPPLARTIGAI